MIRLYRLSLLLVFLCGVLPVIAQQKLKFSVVSFELDQFDLTARNEQYKKVDGNGSLYAIIKVTSANPDDDLKAYNFNFGNMNSLVEQHDGELWVYVQRNAKMVTISRQGYTTINRYDLQTTIEEGRTYTMQLSSQGPIVQKQMVFFQISPADSRAVVMVKGSSANAVEEMLSTNASGQLAKSMSLDVYTYRVMAENYYPSEGRFTLNDPVQTHEETVTLRPRFSMITLTVDADADIYVDGELKGRRSWKGPLNPGNYQVECRQANHRATMQSISVEENKPQAFTLQVPVPITGSLAIISEPLGAAISIGGRDYGTTPRNITDLLVGSHQVKLSKAGYNDLTQTVTVKENETTEVNLTLNDIPVATDEKTFTVTGHGKTVTFKMKLVKAGTFQMGSITGESDEKPVHSVTLTSDYYMGETEVTQAIWYAVTGKTIQQQRDMADKSYSLRGEGDTYPAYYISYADCKQFLRELNQMTGQSFRFPTEAEWEYAARGGSKGKGYTYSGGNDIGDVAWYEGNSGSGTHAVKTKSPNELGLYDMSGNVWEWCQDWYDSYPSSAQTNPTGPSSGSDRVYRGGSYLNNASYCRSAYRFYYGPAYRDGHLGLRLAL